MQLVATQAGQLLQKSGGVGHPVHVMLKYLGERQQNAQFKPIIPFRTFYLTLF
jgi:hypothetical protein